MQKPLINYAFIGDFYCLVKYFLKQNKFERLIVPNRYKYSVLLHRVFSGLPQITFMNDLKNILEYKKSNTGSPR
ncbi:hypothetical protein A3B21_01945 [Candidatus Uhrbacteria bacterium RIFCSPLOWO2_01_FULL_47_24]|uniref:Uncharacterized protein n=1 Tax=Candidatus Uhrbacteria bacterium RIFCSPLOWO2_01_FULL_47_24 TaxID=1802401 RepID=A0A1F7UR13_9BACT|nr:MAG: hypothetical protein A2753_01695 [Candidatus Uhrbacteria bacterium RIFCSPHIGHO2_01_FULL_47_11]OGL67931.1 MAG: hypothetical protein A3D58_05140 [Candidatus Uhrbacteria bacterium RIFCSPHIGHO2_02_FULL_46_47]OGL75202.1 MAG: hypothetical protein A3F52_04130 [Candidatus Uhrbacteria bacterium RIFCSPHIGHO2_12_FULL_47_11]OGL80117.1 MAG: hypothetical protein A3B21_01945 [Candidatus Uhrbacteria bacterium RIFCSPLOWO2_01_FULL_47_24]OGL84902.1 MAG: hypothetical protein A3J03_04325 [Candidatus Uhrbact